MSRSLAWHCGAFRFGLDAPLVMGILNVTPDSFSDGGEHEDPYDAVSWGRALAAAGAHIVDVGGESTRPGSEAVTEIAERSRVRPVIAQLAQDGIVVSVDSRHPEVARAAVEAGASIINDISGFADPEMIELAAECDAGVVVMHMQGEPHNMQNQPYYVDVVTDVVDYLLDRVHALESSGVAGERIAIDPGIGFGKTFEHNIALLHALPSLASHGYPVLVGASRKRFIEHITHVAEPRRRVGGSVGAAVEAVRLGASIVRVHDVAETVQALAVAAAIREG